MPSPDVTALDELHLLLQPGSSGLTSAFQPLVDLDGRGLVGYEALCRGPEGSPLARPDRLFETARDAGRTAELDWHARAVALDAALQAGLSAPATLFLNAEPEGLVADPPAGFASRRDRLAAAGVRVVLEITERALTSDPAQLLGAVDRVRQWGWGVAVDDVGAERASLALLPFLAPDVIKLDLRLVQQRTTVQVAEIVNAVRAHAERTGALLLAEGIETEEHAALARSMGARYGQGWLFGRPAPLPPVGAPVHPVELPGCRPPAVEHDVWRSVRGRLPVHRAAKPLLVALSKTLERQALAHGEATVVLGTFQTARFFTPGTADRYATLASSAALVGALAVDLPEEPARGVRGAHLPPGDPLVDEWDLAVVGPHFAAALVAHDLGDEGPDAERRFDYALTYDRDTAIGVAAALVGRLGAMPARPARATVGHEPVPVPPQVAGVLAAAGSLDGLLRRAVEASTTGITVADARLPDLPLVYVNPAFEELSGYPAEQVLGRNCRFLQGAHSDGDGVALVREGLRAGRQLTALLLNQRPDGRAWWNELSISPVHGPDGTITHFIGVQTDVTARVEAERALAHLAHHDALTGLVNRNGFYRDLDAQLTRGLRSGLTTGLLYVDLDGFKQLNDARGHTAGDALLRQVAHVLRTSARSGDVVARLGGDEFAVLLAGLPGQDRPGAELAVAQAASRVAVGVSELGTPALPVRASVGTALAPHDAWDAEGLVQAADRAMYVDKHAGRAARRARDAVRQRAPEG